MPGYELIGQEEFDEIADVFKNGGVLFRHGFDAIRNGVFKVRSFEQAFAQKFGVADALAVSSGTAAVRIALAALGVGRNDEVITQSFTFVATAEAIIESGAIPVCTEIDEHMNIDPEDLRRKITSRTRAIVVVHMLGTPARMDAIQQVAAEHGLPVVEDTAWGCGGRLGGRLLGTIGDAGCFSFDFAKTMTTGEGGMLVFRSPEAAARARAWHDHGHDNNPALPRWEDSRSSSGFNYRMTELQGAVGLAQLKKLDGVVTAQRANKALLQQAIKDLPGLQFRAEPRGSEETADALIFHVRNSAVALECRQALLGAGLGTKILPEAVTWHFAGTWHHMPELVAAHGGNLKDAFPRTTDLLSRSVALPVSVKMGSDVPNRVRAALAPLLSEAGVQP
jgi:8-amino-3,8-dideoxy-alpha-D-manno-octulosonate transaminase